MYSHRACVLPLSHFPTYVFLTLLRVRDPPLHVNFFAYIGSTALCRTTRATIYLFEVVHKLRRFPMEGEGVLALHVLHRFVQLSYLHQRTHSLRVIVYERALSHKMIRYT